MRSVAILARMAFGLLLFAPQILSAAPVARAGRHSIKATASDLFKLADALVRRGTPERAEPILLLLARDPDPDIRNEARFRHSLILEKAGRERDAAILLRRILDDRPDVAAVRLKLATMLQRLGDEQSALRELRALGTLDLPLSVARFVDRLAASLQASKPLGIQVELALAPDSNVNRATRSDTIGTLFGDFTLDEEAKAESGLGASLRGRAHIRLPLSDKVNLAARVGSETNLYRSSRFNDISFDLAAGPELRLGRTRLTAEAGVVRYWYGMKPYQRSLRAAASVTRLVDSVSQARLDLGARKADNRFNDLQDGAGVSARMLYERALSPRLLVSASLGVDRFKAEDAAYSTRSWSAGLAAYREVGRMTLSSAVEYARLTADERLRLLPRAREDRLLRVTFGAVFRQFTVGGFAPMTRLTVERNRSTLEFHDYRRTRTEFGISRAF